jgi:hypothetical protein
LDEFFSRRCSVELRLLPRILLGRPRLVETERRACAHGRWVGGGGRANPRWRARRRGALEASIGGVGVRVHRRRRAHSGAAARLLVGLRCRDSPRHERRPCRASDRRYQPRSRRPPWHVVAYRPKLSLRRRRQCRDGGLHGRARCLCFEPCHIHCHRDPVSSRPGDARRDSSKRDRLRACAQCRQARPNARPAKTGRFHQELASPSLRRRSRPLSSLQCFAAASGRPEPGA